MADTKRRRNDREPTPLTLGQALAARVRLIVARSRTSPSSWPVTA
jgi:hypothetical protein